MIISLIDFVMIHFTLLEPGKRGGFHEAESLFRTGRPIFEHFASTSSLASGHPRLDYHGFAICR
jgi:hypothetical protein